MAIIGPDGVTPVSSRKPGDEQPVPPPFIITTMFDGRSGLASVKMRQPGAPTAFILTPGEAMALGIQLMLRSESAVANAVAMRMLTEPSMGAQLPEAAAQILEVMNRGTREAHALAEQVHLEEQMARMQRAREAGEAAAQGAGQNQAPPDSGPQQP